MGEALDGVRVLTAALAAAQSEESTALMVGRQCRLENYSKQKVKAIGVNSEMIAYASPESTFAVTRQLLDSAEKSILIGIYDFTAAHVKELVVNAMSRGVKVSMMLDIDGAGERRLFDDLKRLGCDAISAPSCAGNAHFFASSHEKVIVIDGLWTMVQSGNYSNNSCPFNVVDGGNPAKFVHGNRDMGLAIKSKEIASFFTKILKSDMDLERNAAALALEREPTLEETFATAAPKEVPPRTRSKRFQSTASTQVLPVLSPDNYMQVIPDALAKARKSIFIEQQYIKTGQPEIRKLLNAIKTARDSNSGLDVRIVLARPLGGENDVKKGLKQIEALSEFGLRMGKNVRLLSPRHYVHCHNKLIIIDGETVLISSQNWSDAAVVKNREAGLLLKFRALAQYYSKMFESDWKNGVQRLEDARASVVLPAAALNSGRPMVRLELGDYVEV